MTKEERLEKALALLQEARELSKDAPRTASRIRLAISSIRGAIRNAGMLRNREVSQ